MAGDQAGPQRPQTAHVTQGLATGRPDRVREEAEFSACTHTGPLDIWAVHPEETCAWRRRRT